MDDGDTLILAGAALVAIYLFSEKLNPPLNKQSGTTILQYNGNVVRPGTLPGTQDRVFVETGGGAHGGQTVYSIRDADWSQFNFAQRALLRADAAFVPGDWLTRWVMG